MAQRPRVQVAPLRGPVQREVLQQADSTFIRPTGVVDAPVMRRSQLFDDSAAQNADRLINSLGQLNRNLQAFSQSQMQLQAQQQQETDTLINAKLVRMTDSEVLDAQRKGDFAGVQQNSAKVALATRHGQIIRSQIEQGFANGEVDFSDPAAPGKYIRSKIGTYIDENGVDEFTSAQVGNILGGQFAAMEAKGAEHAAKQARTQTLENLPASYDLALKRWEDQPEDKRGSLGDYIWGQHEKQLKGLNLSVGEGDAILMKYAESAAEQGRMDIIDAIFNHKNPNTGGTLGNKLSYKEAYLKLQEKARGAYREAQYEGGEFTQHAELQTRVQAGEATDEEINSAPYLKGSQKASMITQRNAAKARRAEEIRVYEEDQNARITGENMQNEALLKFIADSNNGNGHEFTDLVVPDGRNSTKVVTRKDLGDQFNRVMEAQVRKGTMDEAQRVTEELRFYGGNGLKNERWATLFKAGSAAATEVKIMSPTDIPESTKQAYMVYNTVKAKNPTLLSQQGLIAADERIFSMAEQAQRYQNLTPEQALMKANHKYRMEIETGVKPITRFPLEDAQIERRAGKLIGSTYRNAALTDAWKSVYADAREMGMDETAANTEANKYIERSYNVINGAAVKITQDTPNDFKPLMTEFIKQWSVEYGEKFGGIPEDVIIPVNIPGTNEYTLIDRRTMLPPYLPEKYKRGNNNHLLVNNNKLREFRKVHGPNMSNQTSAAGNFAIGVTRFFFTSGDEE